MRSKSFYLSPDIQTTERALLALDKEIIRLRKLGGPTDSSNVVSQSVLWLVSGQKYIGTIIIRHKARGRVPEIASHFYYEIRPSERGKGYGSIILRLGLVEARRLGIKHPIVACDEQNISSLKVIQTNGGVLLDQTVVNDAEGQSVVRRFIF